jgi:two-component system chemotaxis response regulator CheB
MDPTSREPDTPRLIGFVAATGGITALPDILGCLPYDFPVPILVVFSIHPDFLEEFVTRVDKKCSLRVIVAQDGQVPEPGTVYVASEDPCLLVVDGRLRLERADPDSIRRPKDALFRSMAQDQGSGALAVILTGMGADGAEGMRVVRDAGGYTIVQDESTCVVYGTGRAAERLGAFCESLPIQEIAPKLCTLVATGPPGPLKPR